MYNHIRLSEREHTSPVSGNSPRAGRGRGGPISIHGLQVRNKWLIRAFPKAIKLVRIALGETRSLQRSGAALSSKRRSGNQRAVACPQRTEKYVVSCLQVNSES